MGSALWGCGVRGSEQFGGSLPVAAVTTDLGCGVEKDLDLGVRKHDGADVAALHDYATELAKGALLLDHPGAKMRVDGDLRGGRGYVLLADAAGEVHVVGGGAVSFELGLERYASASGEVEQRCLLVEGVIVLNRFEGEGAVHGSGLEVEKAETAGEMGGKGALARASRPVDGNNGGLG